MNRRWVRSQNAFILNENNENDDWNEDDDKRIINEQVEHTSHVIVIVYARDINEHNEKIIIK